VTEAKYCHGTTLDWGWCRGFAERDHIPQGGDRNNHTGLKFFRQAPDEGWRLQSQVRPPHV